MNNFLRLVLLAVITAFLPSSLISAASAQQNKIDALTRKENQLESQLKDLSAEISRLKADKDQRQHEVSYEHIGEKSASSSNKLPSDEPVSPQATTPDNSSTVESDLLKVSPEVLSQTHQTAINYIHGITVTTSPILGLKSAWNPSDLLYSIPSMNQDLRLLRDRQEFETLLQSMGSTLNNRPLLVFSGALENTLFYLKGYNNREVIDVNLTTAEIDLWAIISDWTSAFISLDYDASSPETGSRVTNSRLFIQRGFFTIGDLSVSPVYMTIGQMYVPFGRYASAMVTTPLTTSLARTEARAVLLGYYKKGFYSEAYGYRGDRLTPSNRIIFQGGTNLGYENPKLSIGSLDIGAGYITNIADSQGMQNNGLFQGFNFPSTQFGGLADSINANGFPGNNLVHAVPGVDFHMEYSRAFFSLITELVGAVKSFNPGDIMYDYGGAKPRAMHLEMDFNFKIGHRPLTFGTAFDQSWDALALNLPRQSFFMVLSTSIWKDTVQSLEYRHDINYPLLPNNSVGGGGNGNILLNLPVPSANQGGSQDLVTLLFGVYF